jgi:DNA anti-recombination protein RmuC
LILEIHYTYQESKSDDLIDSWTYFFTDIDDLEKATKKANSHYKNFIKEHGWGRKAKLKSIQKLRNEQDPAPIVVVKPPTPKRRKRTSKASSPSQTSSRTTKPNVRRK